jgi:hypothetical protein
MLNAGQLDQAGRELERNHYASHMALDRAKLN